MTTTATAKQAKTPLAPGEQRTFLVPGTSAVVFVQRHHVGHYGVWVEVGTRVDEWAGTFATETEARAEFLRAARAFHAHRTAVGIEARRNQLAIELTQQHARAARRMHNPDRIATIEAELAALESFGDRALMAQLRNDLADRYAA